MSHLFDVVLVTIIAQEPPAVGSIGQNENFIQVRFILHALTCLGIKKDLYGVHRKC
jgi:hypothetical protein